MAFSVVLDHPPVSGREPVRQRLGRRFLKHSVTALLRVPLFALTIVAIVAAAADHPILPADWVGPAWAAWIRG